jgi:glycosyltransferase involved in cell wall biosynthesis
MIPEISIIVPVYNVEPYLKDCVSSILAQSFKDFEIILVNDGSIDRSGDICDEFSKQYSNIKVIHQPYGGVSSARNAGIAAAKGNFIGFVDGDDRIDRGMYGELYKLCMETNSDISICKLGREINGKLINPSNELFIKEMDRINALHELFKGNLFRFSLCNKLFKKKCFENITFPVGRIHEDLSTTYRLFANADKAVFTNYIGYIYIKRENSILTSTFSEKRLDAFIGWDEIITFMNNRYGQLSEVVISSFGFWLVDYIFYIFNQVKDKDNKEKYLYFVQTYVRKYFKQIRSNRALALNYKVVTTLLYFNVKVLIAAINIKNIPRIIASRG